MEDIQGFVAMEDAGNTIEQQQEQHTEQEEHAEQQLIEQQAEEQQVEQQHQQHQQQEQHQILVHHEQSSMDEVRRTKVLLCFTVLLLLLAFMFMITAVCTPYWYKNFPVLDEPDAYGHFGLLERCGGTINENECSERDGVLKFHDTSWPYEPLVSRDFDVILLLLILSMMMLFLTLTVSLFIYCRYCSEAIWRRYLLLLLSFLTSLLALCGTSYFENRDKRSTADEDSRYEHGWSSYLAWVAVFTLLLVNVPVLYLCYLCYIQTDIVSRSHHYNNNYPPTAPPVENHYEVIYEKEPYEKRNVVDVD